MNALEHLELIPSLEELPARPKRAILHWNGWNGVANENDREHYHFLFNQPDGAIVVGKHPVAHNMRKLSSGMSYAAHTGGFNSYSVGFAFCGMRDASPGYFGRQPLLKEQVMNGLRFVGLCLWAWGLDPLNPAHLFTHYEAWTIHRVKGQRNDQKFDITMLTWLHAGPDEVGPYLRTKTHELLREIIPEPSLELAVEHRLPFLVDIRQGLK